MSIHTGAIDMGKGGEGLIRFVGIEELEAKEAEKKKVEQELNNELHIGLAAFLNKKWDKAKTNKSAMERKLLKAKRQRRGEYDPEDLQQIQQFGGSTIFMMITNVKCRAIESFPPEKHTMYLS